MSEAQLEKLAKKDFLVDSKRFKMPTFNTRIYKFLNKYKYGLLTN